MATKSLKLLLIFWLLSHIFQISAEEVTQYKIAFNVEEIGTGAALYVANLDGSTRRQLTDLVEGYEGRPNWIPDGRAIVFESDRSAFPENSDYDAERKLIGGQIYLAYLDNPVPIRLTNALRSAGSAAGHPILSPDGKLIAYWYQSSLYIMNVDGTQPTHLVDTGSIPVWSPDSCCIAFTQRTSDNLANSERRIMLVNIATRELTQVTNRSGYDSVVAWSAATHQLLVASDRNGTLEYYRMNPDGAGVIQITHDGSEGKLYQTWSPNGQWLAYNEATPNTELPCCYDWVIRTLDGELLLRLPETGGTSGGWIPDSSGFLFYGAENGRLVIQQLDTSCLETVPVTCDDGDITTIPGTETLGFVSDFAVSPIKLPSE